MINPRSFSNEFILDRFKKFLLLAGRMEMGKAKKGKSDKSQRRNQDTNNKDLIEKIFKDIKEGERRILF